MVDGQEWNSRSEKEADTYSCCKANPTLITHPSSQVVYVNVVHCPDGQFSRATHYEICSKRLHVVVRHGLQTIPDMFSAHEFRQLPPSQPQSVSQWIFF